VTTVPAADQVALGLGAVLLASGVAKLPRPRAATTAGALAAGGLRVTVPLVRAAAVVEVLLAVVLVGATGTTAAVAAGSVLVLLAGYTAVLVRVRGSGSDHGCACHGQAGGRVSGRTFARNAVLASGAAWVMADRLAAVPVGARWALVVATAVAAVAAVLVVARMPRRADDRSAAPVVPVEPLAADPSDYVRWPVPAGPLLDGAGESVSLRDLCHEGARLVVVVDGRRAVPPAVDGWLRRVAADAPVVRPAVVVAYQGPGGLDRRDLPTDADVLADPPGVVAAMLGGLLPSVTILGADGWLAGGPAGGLAAAERLVADLVAELAAARDGVMEPAR
jgi:hypothetical protein